MTILLTLNTDPMWIFSADLAFLGTFESATTLNNIREGEMSMSDTAVISNEVMGTQVRQETSLRDSVKNSLENYFAQLGSETPANLYDMVLEQIELPLLQRIMAYTGNNQSKAAKVLGLSRGTLRKKLKIYDLL